MTERTSARVLVVGSINTYLVVRSRVLPGPGETVLGESFFKAGGGKGANQAVAAARAGAAVTFVGRVGHDDFGREAREAFAREGIVATLVTTDPVRPSGVALIVVDAEGQNSIAVAPGANGAITPEHVSSATDAFSAADVCLVQLEIPLPAVSRAAELAADHGVPVVLNPAPACELPPDLLQRTAVIVPNESETECLTGIRPDSDTSARTRCRRGGHDGCRRRMLRRACGISGLGRALGPGSSVCFVRGGVCGHLARRTALAAPARRHRRYGN